jgi:hypothetical protein
VTPTYLTSSGGELVHPLPNLEPPISWVLGPPVSGIQQYIGWKYNLCKVIIKKLLYRHFAQDYVLIT